MDSDRSLRRYRRWYAALLRLYPEPYRRRFGAEIELTFRDLLRERAARGKGLASQLGWLYADTFISILRENLTVTFMHSRPIIRAALLTMSLLLIPLWGNRFVEGWNWTLSDFLGMGTLIFGTGLLYELIASRSAAPAYRAGIGLATATGFVLLWANLAVGIIGPEDNPANLMYFGVLAVAFLGAVLVRFRPRALARVLFATAFAQALVPWLALANRSAELSPGFAPVLVLNTVFVLLFFTSALLLRRADPKKAI